jgi:hypothetical protein
MAEQFSLFFYVPDWLDSPLYLRAMALLDARERHELSNGYQLPGPGELPENRRYTGKNVWTSL